MFQDYYASLNPEKTDNPWFHKLWNETFPDCEWNSPDPDKKCDPDLTISNSSVYSYRPGVSTIIDTVRVFAVAMDRYVSDHCVNMPPSSLHTCIRGDGLLEYLKNVSIYGYNGNISFDENGDARGRYEILNFQGSADGGYAPRRVAIWDVANGRLDINDTQIVWNVEGPYSELGWNSDGMPQQVNVTAGGEVPQSNCGDQCGSGEIYSYYKDTCCWECRPCNNNEITVDNLTRCQPCALYMWPNDNRSACHLLQPYHLEWDSPATVVLSALGVLGLVYCACVISLFIYHNSARLIKATSRELSYIMLCGTTIQYLLIFPILHKPTPTTCFLNFMTFNVSFAVIYSALLTRTNRIYRIFNAGKRTRAMPAFTSPLSQVVIALLLISVQVSQTFSYL